MLALKFLRPGAVGPFSGHRWPVPSSAGPGAWVEATDRGGVCRDGVHACEVRHLPLWIWAELWGIELEGPVEARPHKLRAPRGRLVRRVEAWSPPAAKAFARACARRAAQAAAEPLRAGDHRQAAGIFELGEDLEAVRAWTAELWERLPGEARIPVGMASDGALRALTAAASDDPEVAANGAAVTGYIAARTADRVAGPAAYDLERAAQIDWLRNELDLGPLPA
jgi:hypothetical protein